MNMTRMLGGSGIKVSAIGMGCWPIGGNFTFRGKVDGYGSVDDRESKLAILRALELGCNFFDTSDVYGTGHSEELLGEALKGRRNNAVLATKFGYLFDPVKREASGAYDVSEAYVIKACEASLKRLQTDYIDLYQIHVGELKEEELQSAIAALDRLKAERKIREYGWSTGNSALAGMFVRQSNGVSFQFGYNLFKNSGEEQDIIKLCEKSDYAGIANSPLAMGFLSGRFNADSKIGPDDVRGSGFDWVPYFIDGKPKKDFLTKLEAIREILTSGGRSLVQGAIAWVWAQSDCLIPIAGFKSVKQAEENVSAMRFGPLAQDQVGRIASILSGS